MNIMNNELFMNHHSSFNDPFECRCKIAYGFPTLDSNSPRLVNIFDAWGFEYPKDSFAHESYDDLVISLEGAAPDIPHILDSARISCFSKREDNLLMWAHYANGLRGLCLEFDANFLLKLNKAELLEVLYDNKPSEIDTAVLAILYEQIDNLERTSYQIEERRKNSLPKESEVGNDDLKYYTKELDAVYLRNSVIYQKMLATKSLEWSYEEELRVVLHTEKTDTSGVFMKYPSKALKAITIGEKMPEKQQETIVKIAQSHSNDISLKKASIVDGSFQVVITDL